FGNRTLETLTTGQSMEHSSCSNNVINGGSCRLISPLKIARGLVFINHSDVHFKADAWYHLVTLLLGS
ncbi:hypothetical protein EJB05_49481, partial [Eragrostis curvula]